MGSLFCEDFRRIAVSLARSTPTGEVPVRVTLTETGGFWYIDTVTVSGVPLQ